MEILTAPIAGLLIIKPRVFEDERGYFYESYASDLYREAGITSAFMQDNQSSSKLGTLRGLHFQASPFEQGKLVRVISGKVLDIAVDIRKGSPTYGQHFSIELSGKNHTQFWIPPGFAHGFLALEEGTIFCYKCTNTYNKSSEGGINWNDPELKIQWGNESPLVSSKDEELPFLRNFSSPF